MAITSRETRSNEVKARAEANFKKEEREKDGAKAMLEYLASGREIRERMARLRALRLAKEAQEEKEAQAQEAGAQGSQARELQELSAKVRKPAVRRKPAKAQAIRSGAP